MGHDNSFGSVIGASVAAIVYFGLGYYFRRKDETETNNSPSRIMCSSALSGYGIYMERPDGIVGTTWEIWG
eukprot:g4775.t1